MLLQNPRRLFPCDPNRIAIATPLFSLGGQLRQLPLAHMIARVLLGQEVPLWSYRVDHIQRESLLAGVQTGEIDADVMVAVRIQQQSLGVEQCTAF